MFKTENERIKRQICSRRSADSVILGELKNEELSPEKRQELISRYESLLDEHYKEEYSNYMDLENDSTAWGMIKGATLLGWIIIGADVISKVVKFFFHKKE